MYYAGLIFLLYIKRVFNFGLNFYVPELEFYRHLLKTARQESERKCHIPQQSMHITALSSTHRLPSRSYKKSRSTRDFIQNRYNFILPMYGRESIVFGSNF